MEVEKETGANANKRGPPDGPNAAENEWPVIPVTAAAAAAASLTTGQLDSTACGVQLGSGAVATIHGSAASGQAAAPLPPTKSPDPKRTRADPDSPEPLPGGIHQTLDVPYNALTGGGAMTNQQVYDELMRLGNQQHATNVWAQTVDSCLSNHKQRLVRDRAKIAALQTGASSPTTMEPRRMEMLIEQRAKQAHEQAEAATSAVDARVATLEADLNTYTKDLDERLKRADGVITDYQKRFEGVLQQYTSRLEAKLAVLEGGAGDAAQLAQAAQQGTLTLHDLVPSVVKLQQAVADVKATCDLREAASKSAQAVQEEAVSLDLAGTGRDIRDLRDALEGMNTAIQVYETGTDASITRLGAEVRATRLQTQALATEVQASAAARLSAPVREPPGITHAPPTTGASATGLWAPQATAYHEIFTPMKVPTASEPAPTPTVPRGSVGIGVEPTRQPAGLDPLGAHDPWDGSAWRSPAPPTGPYGQPPPQARGRVIDVYTRVFDPRDHKDFKKFDGHRDQEEWHKITKRHLISCAPDIEPLLKWAELQPQEIRNDELSNATKHPDIAQMWMQGMLLTRPDVLSHHLWGFLGSNLTAYAMTIFESCGSRQGLEVWRRLLKDHVRKTPAEQMALEDAAMNPKMCSNLGDVEAGFLRWETALKKYHDTLPTGSTERLSEQRQLRAVTKMLPMEVQKKVLWDHPHQFATTYDLLEWVLDLARSTRHLDSRSSPSRLADLVGSLDEEDDDETRAEVLALGEHASDAEINAVVQRRSFKRNYKRRPPGQQQTSVSKVPDHLRGTCANCLEKGHSARECTKAKVPGDQRRCFICKQIGHFSWKCPKAESKGKVAQVTAGADVRQPPTTAPPRILCVDCDGFVPAQRTVRVPTTVPKPVGARTLAAFVTPNKFAGLSQAERKQRWRNYTTTQETATTATDHNTGRCMPGDRPQGSLPCAAPLGRASNGGANSSGANDSSANDRGGSSSGADNSGADANSSANNSGANNSGANPNDSGDGTVTPTRTNRATTPEQRAPIPAESAPASSVASASPVAGAEFARMPAINLLFEQEMAVMNVDVAEFIDFEVAWDTGSIAHVLDKCDAPGYTLQESEGSRRGQMFNDASGGNLPNEGQVELHLVSEGQEVNSTFQVTCVTKPLWSISTVLDNLGDEDSEVVFKRKEAVVRGADGRILARAQRRGGLYVSKMRMRNPHHPSFTRPA